MSMIESIRCAQISSSQLDAEGMATFEFCFPNDDPTFAGHFPARPLLPGVFQLEIARYAAETVLNRPLVVREITKARFLRPIIPAETVLVELKLTRRPDTLQARVRFSVTGRPAGEAILVLAERA
jgi:3-hydroxymyristoyl/3-hydroxydecanoyl-(acyl carrier protein) dehydratase